MILSRSDMPAHILHCIFGEDALFSALEDEADTILDAHGAVYKFGCQGPDFFYHNQRTKPSAMRFGSLIHRHGFGSLIMNMVRAANSHEGEAFERTAAYILGFATHAFLDRAAHPYIGYHSGWVSPRVKESHRFLRCHPFLERIIDVLMLKICRTTSIADFDFLSEVDCGQQLPDCIVEPLGQSIATTYQQDLLPSGLAQRIANAYQDTILFYRMTNPRDPHCILRAYQRDEQDGFRTRRLALLHPHHVPEEIDFLNTGKKTWCHPCDDQVTSDLSFQEVYADALAAVRPAIRTTWRAIHGELAVKSLAETIGNENLDTGKTNESPCRPTYSKPFPLPELLDEMYANLARPDCRSAVSPTL